MLDQLGSTDFAPYLNQIFRVRLEGIEPLELELVRVAAAGRPARPGSREPFSLQFLGPVSSHYLVQQIYRLEHDSMGTLGIFLVPLGLEGGRMRYEAIFN